MPIDLAAATSTLRTRLLTKIVQPGPATPCATWIGAYNAVGQTSLKKHCKHHRRPLIRLGGRRAPMAYVAPLLLALADRAPAQPAQVQACHRGCPCGATWHGLFSCVDLDHLYWGSQAENEADKL